MHLPVASRNQYGYLVPVTRRQPRDEGAAYTAAVMAEVKRLRLGKVPTWSAERLAAEMTGAGVPWNADIVVNLEHGRRKSLRVHELLALAYVLDVANPVNLLVPGPGRYFQVTPNHRIYRATAQAWFEGRTGPLRNRRPFGPESIAEAAAELAGQLPPEAGVTPDAMEAMLKAHLARRQERQERGNGQD